MCLYTLVRVAAWTVSKLIFSFREWQSSSNIVVLFFVVTTVFVFLVPSTSLLISSEVAFSNWSSKLRSTSLFGVDNFTVLVTATSLELGLLRARSASSIKFGCHSNIASMPALDRPRDRCLGLSQCGAGPPIVRARIRL